VRAGRGFKYSPLPVLPTAGMSTARMLSILPLLSIIWGCDTTPNVDPDPEVPPSHFVAKLNGAPWETIEAEGGYSTTGFSFVVIRKQGPSGHYAQAISVQIPRREPGTYIGATGRSMPLDTLVVRAVEYDDHVLFGVYRALTPPVLVLYDVEASRRVIRGTLSATLVVDAGYVGSPYRQLPDTLRLEEAVFSIGLKK